MKTKLLLITLLAGVSAFGQKSSLKFKFGEQIGYDNNIFLSPRDFTDGGVLVPVEDLIQNGMFNNISGSIDYSWTAKKKKQFFNTSLSSHSKNYFNPDLASFYGLSYFSKSSFKHKYQKYSWVEASLTAGRERKVRTTIVGDEYTRPYSYYQAYPKITVQQRVIKNTWLQVWGGYDARTYDGRDTISNFQTFSYNSLNFGANLSYRHKLFGNLVTYEASWTRKNRQYTEWLIDEVVDEQGREITLDSLLILDPAYEYPLNLWVYDIYKLKIKYKVAKGLNVELFGGVSIKEDMGEGDFGFTTPNYGGNLSYKKGTFFVKYDYRWMSRNYHNRLAYRNDADGEEFLFYEFTNHKLYMSYGVSKKLRVNATFTTENRSTNSTDLSKKFRRSYFTYGAMVGASYGFSKKLKKKRGR